MKWINKISDIIQDVVKSKDSVEETTAASIDICNMPVEQESFFSPKEELNPLQTEEFLSEQAEERQRVENSEEVEAINETIEETATQGSQPIEQTSLLDNADYMTLAQQCCEMLGELDRMYNQVSNDQLKSFIIQQKSRIREALMLSGATLIDEETEFNMLRHQSVEGGIVKNGTPISEFVEAGVEIDGRVMVKGKIL